MKILAIDTSSSNCSVSIVEADSNSFNIIKSKDSNDEKTHSQKLMPMINEIFTSSNLSLDNIDLLASCVGPGSFTGIRIGIATVKAFSDVKNIKTVGVTSLESLAYNVSEEGYICSLLDCKNNNVYAALFMKKEGKYYQLGDNIAESIDLALDKIKEILAQNEYNSSTSNITFVGDASVLYKDLICEKFLSLKLNFSEHNIQSSISLSKCAYDEYTCGNFGDSNAISPLYLRKSQAERSLEENKREV